MKIVVDTNVLFSALIRSESQISRVLFLGEGHDFYAPRIAVVELFKYKEKILKAVQCDEETLLEQLHRLLKRLNFINEDQISLRNYTHAWQLAKQVDPKDFLFVALTLELDGVLWTGDKALVQGLQSLGFARFFQP